MRVVWLTDIHLSFLRLGPRIEFLREVAAVAADAIIITGDIAEAPELCGYLEEFDDAVSRPTYFVLGNHDFYYGSIEVVRRQMVSLCDRRPNLRYLTHMTSVSLTQQVGLVGHDGWADARLGNYLRSYVDMNDHRFIREFEDLGKLQRWPVLQRLGDEAASHLERVLPTALAVNPHVVVATHVPPWRAACWHEGQLSDDEWAPHFTCQAVGDKLLDIMSRFPDRQLTVLCGHTHGSGECQPAPNIHVITGGAEYEQPAVCRIFDW